MSKTFKKVLKLCAYLFVTGCVAISAMQPLSAQVVIPQGSTINSAIFSVYAFRTPGQVVSVRRVTADWGECSVTLNSILGSIDPAIVDNIVTDSLGWKTFDLTALVQGWVNGAYPNFGFIMQQDPNTERSYFWSSEFSNVALRPKLEIWYTTPAGAQYVLIQRPGADQDGVADTHVRDYFNYCHEVELVTGWVNGLQKASLVRFHFTVVPSSPGTGTPGYWMNHPEAWPEEGITIGGIFYPKADAIALMQMPVAGDKTYTMFAALVAAKLNVLIHNDASCISSTITAADAWMLAHPVGSGVIAGGALSFWRTGEPLYLMLDQYNNGLLCAPHRD